MDSGNKDASRKKPKYSVQKDPILNHTAFYLLPDDVLDRCIEVMPLANKEDGAIPVFSQSQSSQDLSQDPAHGQRRGTECVAVAGFGTYSRVQIEAMRHLAKLKQNCIEGQSLCAWLRKEVSDFAFDGRPAHIADDIEAKYPYAKIPGLEVECTYEKLYRVRPPPMD
jgi:hypothetical protein